MPEELPPVLANSQTQSLGHLTNQKSVLSCYLCHADTHVYIHIHGMLQSIRTNHLAQDQWEHSDRAVKCDKCKTVFHSLCMQHRMTPTGEPEKGEAADGRRRLSMNSLESLYSLTSRQSSSSKHPKAGGQMHSSHSTLMNYATPPRHSHFTPFLTSDEAKPNPKPS